MPNTEMIVFPIISIVILFLTSWVVKDEAYKKGQTDALSGKQKYRLVEFEDGTRDFYKESDLKDLVAHKVIK